MTATSLSHEESSSAGEPQDPDIEVVPARRRVPGALISLACALALVVLIFPEIFFAGGSFSTVPLDRVVGQPTPARTVTVIPNLGNRKPTSGLADLGAHAWQFEPTIRYMAGVLRHRTNPDWNPWLASGELGPESLDGMQLSPVVLAIAALGGGPTAFTFGLMAFIVLALYCLMQLFTRTLGMRRLAGVGACVVFLLNGWTTSTMTDVTCVPYLLFPVVLYAVAEFQRRIGPGRFALAVAAYAGLLLSTFSPGQVMDIILITLVAVVLDVWRRHQADPHSSWPRLAATELGLQAAVPAVAMAAIAVLVLPALAAFLHAGTDITDYSHQVLVTMSPNRWLGVPTWVTQPLQTPTAVTQQVTYLGLAPIIFTLAAWPRTRGRSRWLLSALVVVAVLALTQHLGLPGFKLIGDLPGLRIIENAYWGSLAAGAVTLAVGVAVDTAMDEGVSFGVVIALVAAASVMVTLAAVNATGSDVRFVAVFGSLAVALLLGCVLGLVWLADRGLIGRTLLGALAVLVMALELGTYQNHSRTLRSDDQQPPAQYIQFLQRNVGNGRVLDFGKSSMLGDWGAALGIRDVGTFDIMQVSAYRDFFRAHIGHRGRFLQLDRVDTLPFTADPAALDLLSVRYLVVADGDELIRQAMGRRFPLAFHDPVAKVSVYANPQATPRATVVPALASGPVPVAADGALQATPGQAHTTDPALLAGASRAGIPTTSSGTRPGRSTARITHDGSTQVTVVVDASAPSVLVLGDTYQSNWRATVDGRSAHVGPVDDVVRGVVVPAGHSVVVFRYHSTARTIGWVITLVTLVALLVGCLWWARARRIRADRQRSAPAL